MIIIVSKNESFKKSASLELNKFGYITFFSDYLYVRSLNLPNIDLLFLIHTSSEVKDLAQASVSDILLNFPKSKILVAAEIEEGSPARYLELEGSDKQLILPFTAYDLIQATKLLLPSAINVKEEDR